jgi:hypothetical protein
VPPEEAHSFAFLGDIPLDLIERNAPISIHVHILRLLRRRLRAAGVGEDPLYVTAKARLGTHPRIGMKL